MDDLLLVTGYYQVATSLQVLTNPFRYFDFVNNNTTKLLP